MDPNTCLAQISGLLAEVKRHNNANAREELAERVDALKDWLNKGGFAPKWGRYPVATAYFELARQGFAKEAEKLCCIPEGKA